MSFKPVPKWVAANLGIACTHATKGYGLGLAIACGKHTVTGKMMELSFKARPETRVTKHMKQVGCYVLCVAIVVIFLLICMISREDLWILLGLHLCLMVALLPLYLPFIVYWGLRQTKDRMRDNQCYARNLEATSTLGLTSVIVTDMSRTMTKRWMRVSEVFVDMELKNAESPDVSELGPRFVELIQASVLCNDAVINPGNNGVPKVKKSMYGNVLDIALLRYGLLMLPDINQLRRDHEKVANKTYTSLDRVQVTVHRTRGADGQLKLILLMKGHCDTVIRRCSTFSVHDEEHPLDDLLQDTIISLADGLLAAGRHVRAFAYKELDNDLEMRRVSQVNSGAEGGEGMFRDYLAVDTFSLRFLGLIATYNPPRSTIPKAVARCRSAGIKLVVVTSHELNMARSLALEVGIMSSPLDGRSTLSPTDLVDMSEYAEEKNHHQQWYIEQMLLNQRDLVCANANAEQLHWIVDACQRLGAVVTVIGGSLHDTPAVRSGHVGVARFGCATMCEASADLILLDSSFATLTGAIGVSRLLFMNLKKALAYCLAPNMTSIVIYLAFFVIRLPLVPHIIDLIILAVFVNLLPALTLLYEHPEERVMMQKPMIYDDFLLNSRLFFVSHILVGTVEAAAVFLTYFVFMAKNGFVPGTLVGLNLQWYDETVNDITDSYGQEWSYVEREKLNCQVSTLCLMALVLMQCTNLVLTKTGRANLLEFGFENWRLGLAVVYLFVLCVLMCVLDSPLCRGRMELQFGTFLWIIWPLVVLLVFLESTRRYFLRLFPDSWLERATMY